ncbi:hypothetical protein NUW58_g1026 [Xylaria curta]|uniref:Uncharacterized protein n=1 Tax=Xylaria curta TaxID=42375 RepID=A0ACC1PPZ5_9PEZI|nr:hypothetical protein NUW58_g1026 [Xylaria curta]
MSDRIANGPAAHFSITDSDAHMHVALSCLAYHLHRSSTSEEDDKALKLTADPPESRAMLDKKWPLNSYAVKNWMPHLELVPREKWSVDVVNLATRALTARSESLSMIIEGNNLVGGRGSEYYVEYGYFKEPNLLRRPQCVTARLGCVKLTEMLLCASAGINSYLTQGDFYMALQYAARGGHTAVIQSLLEKVVCDNTKSDKLGKALVAAAYEGHADVVNLLLDSNADVDAPHDKWGVGAPGCRMSKSLACREVACSPWR